MNATPLTCRALSDAAGERERAERRAENARNARLAELPRITESREYSRARRLAGVR